MSPTSYLREVLRAQQVQPDSPEMKALRSARSDIEALIEQSFSDCSPTVRYGGSKMKNTMNLEDYDLDIINYFPRTDTRAGGTIKEIYHNVAAALRTKYQVEERTTALRVRDADRDLKIDVVPGRFTDNTNTFAYVHQKDGPKPYLQTYLDRHIEFVRDSGCTEEIRLAKLWRPCAGIKIRTFPLELVVIKILGGSRLRDLDDRMTYLLTEIRDCIATIAIEDPANSGNDLSSCLDGATRSALALGARTTLNTVAQSGWSPVFRAVMDAELSARQAVHRISVIRNEERTPPWAL